VFNAAGVIVAPIEDTFREIEKVYDETDP